MRDQEEVSIHRMESRRESIPVTGTRACKGHNLGKLGNHKKTNVMANVSSRDLGNNLHRLAAKTTTAILKITKTRLERGDVFPKVRPTLRRA